MQRTDARVRRETLAMEWLALATDYDGTLAHAGAVDDLTTAALDRFRDSDRRLVMVTGRELPDLQRSALISSSKASAASASLN